jgi:hypothetical protein
VGLSRRPARQLPASAAISRTVVRDVGTQSSARSVDGLSRETLHGGRGIMRNQRPITVSKTAQPADEVGIEGQISHIDGGSHPPA